MKRKMRGGNDSLKRLFRNREEEEGGEWKRRMKRGTMQLMHTWDGGLGS